MLDPASTLNTALLALSPTVDKHAGCVAFVNVIGDFMDKVNALGGIPGILTINRPAYVALLETQVPVSDNSWMAPFANAWMEGVAQGIITPGTVTNPAWTASTVDIATLPSPAVTITTLSSAEVDLQSSLTNVKADNTAALPLATDIRNATLEFIFTCIGIVIPAVPLPIPLPAQ